MTHIFVDVDNTLVLWQNRKHPWAEGFEDEYEVNWELVARLVAAMKRGHEVTVWSGGGKVWAGLWRTRLFGLGRAQQISAVSKEPGLTEEGNIIIDDLPWNFDWIRPFLPSPDLATLDGGTVKGVYKVWKPNDFGWEDELE